MGRPHDEVLGHAHVVTESRGTASVGLHKDIEMGLHDLSCERSSTTSTTTRIGSPASEDRCGATAGSATATENQLGEQPRLLAQLQRDVLPRHVCVAVAIRNDVGKRAKVVAGRTAQQ